MTPTLVESLILMILGGIGVVAWWGFRRVLSTQDRIIEHLSILNGRLGRAETWQQSHEARDNERFAELREASRDIRENLARLRGL